MCFYPFKVASTSYNKVENSIKRYKNVYSLKQNHCRLFSFFRILKQKIILLFSPFFFLNKISEM